MNDTAPAVFSANSCGLMQAKRAAHRYHALVRARSSASRSPFEVFRLSSDEDTRHRKLLQDIDKLEEALSLVRLSLRDANNYRISLSLSSGDARIVHYRELGYDTNEE